MEKTFFEELAALMAKHEAVFEIENTAYAAEFYIKTKDTYTSISDTFFDCKDTITSVTILSKGKLATNKDADYTQSRRYEDD